MSVRSGTRPVAAVAARRKRLTGAVPWLLLAVTAVALVLPLLLGHGALTVYVNVLLAAIVASGVGLLMGYAGQVSLGQGAFFAIGALVTALAASRGVPPLLALLLGAAASGLFAAAVGAPLLRLRGHYLAFGTLALQLIVLTVVANVDLFGGPSGIQGIPQLGVGPLLITSPVGYAYAALAVLAVTIAASHRIVRSRFGRGLRALAGSESAAESAGVPVFRTKLQIFSHSAVLAGVAGGIYAFFIGYVSASSFSVTTSFQYIVMAVVGGVGSLWGGVVGAALIVVLLEVLNALGTLPGMPATAPMMLSYAVYAIVLVVTMLFLPEGVLPATTRRLRAFAAVRRGGGPAAATADERGEPGDGRTPHDSETEARSRAQPDRTRHPSVSSPVGGAARALPAQGKDRTWQA